jgi:acyl-CoA dehydrogenase
MDFTFDARTEEMRARLLDFMDSHVSPAELEDRWAWDSVPVLAAQGVAAAAARG